MVESAGAVAPTYINGDQVHYLLDELRLAGFPLGMQEYLDALTVVEECRDSDDLTDPGRLRNWLAPILCTDADEQNEFYRRFDRWWKRFAPSIPREKPPLVPTEKLESEEDLKATRPVKWVFLLMVLMVFLLGVLANLDRLTGFLFPTANLLADFTSIEPGQDVELTWSTSKASETLLEPGIGVIDPSGLMVVNPTSTTSYRLIASNYFGTAEYSVNIIVSESGELLIPTIDFQASATSIASGDEVTLSWVTSDATTVQLESIGPVESSGSLVVNPTSTRTYRLIAGNTYGSAVHELSVEVSDATISQNSIVHGVVMDEEDQPVEGATVASLRYLAASADPLINLQHERRVNGAMYSPDQARILTWSVDGTARVWDAATGAQIGPSLQHDDSVIGAMYSSDQARILTWSDDGTARVWDAGVGAQIGPSLQHNGSLNGAMYSIDQTHILTWSDDGTARMWDAANGAQIGPSLQHDDAVNGAVYSPDQSRILTWSLDGTARVWNAANGAQIGPPLQHDYWVYGATYSPDQSRILTWSFDGTARIWDAASGAQIGPSLQHDDSVSGAMYSPDQSRILTWSLDGTARVWDAASGAQVGPSLQHDDWVNGATYSPDQSRILTWSADGSVRIWDADSGLQTGRLNQFYIGVEGAMYSSDQTRILTWSYDGTTRFWDAASGAKIGPSLQHDGAVIGAMYSPDRSRILTWSDDNTARVWVALISEIPAAHREQVNSVAFSPNGNRVVTASDDATARIWDAVTGAELLILQHDERVWSADFSADGSMVVTGSEDSMARLWDAVSGEDGIALQHDDEVMAAAYSTDYRLVTGSIDGTLRIWEESLEEPLSISTEQSISSVAFDPDGDKVMAGLFDGTARIWDASTGELLTSLDHENSVVEAVAFNPTGSSVATGADSIVRIWDSSSGELLTMLAHENPVTSLAFSLDGSRLVTGSIDGSTQIWETESGNAIAIFQHDTAVNSVAINRDGTQVATGSFDGTVRIWQLNFTTSNAAGEFSLEVNELDVDPFISVSHGTYDQPRPLSIPQTEDLQVLQVEVQLAESIPSWVDRLKANQAALVVSATSLPFLIFLCWWLWKRSRRKVILNRRSSHQRQKLTGIGLQEPDHKLYQGENFVRARIAARKRLQHGSRVLDVNSTVENTTKRLGWFSPIYRSQKQLPEYLVLVDRRSFADQQARQSDEFLKRLREGGVHIERYYFDRDPRLCSPGRAGSTSLRLMELAARYPNYRLILFGDGAGLTNPLTGRMAQWCEVLMLWEHRALMTPTPPSSWTNLEIELASSGLMVVPATPAGLQLFAESIDSVRKLSPASSDWHPALPQTLTSNPGRWLERRQPSDGEIEKLLGDVRVYLGPDGFRWFAAIAVYPQLNWYITLYLGLNLRDSAGTPLLSEESLLRLTRLPWLRKSYMPDWFRLHLLNKMPKEDETIVRGFLFELLRDQMETYGSSFKLDIVRGSGDVGVRAWRRWLSDLFVTEPSDSALHDYVFVEFLFGRPAKKLEVVAPSGWRRWVFHHGSRSLGLRNAPAVITALVISGLGLQSAGMIDSLYTGESSIAFVGNMDGTQQIAISPSNPQGSPDGQAPQSQVDTALVPEIPPLENPGNPSTVAAVGPEAQEPRVQSETALEPEIPPLANSSNSSTVTAVIPEAQEPLNQPVTTGLSPSATYTATSPPFVEPENSRLVDSSSPSTNDRGSPDAQEPQSQIDTLGEPEKPTFLDFINSRPVTTDNPAASLTAQSTDTNIPPLAQRMEAGLAVNPSCGDPRAPSSGPRQQASEWEVAQACLNLIKQYEVFEPRPYKGPGGVELIGYGHAISPSDNLTRVTERQAENLLRTDVARRASTMAQMIKVPVTQNEFSAMACLAYSMDLGRLANDSTMEALNNNQMRRAADQMTTIRRGNGQILEGLVERRQQECSLFLTP